MATKKCFNCKEDKDVNEFWHSKDKPRTYCKSCALLRSRDNDLKRMYGITLLDYNNMFANQEGRCKTCNRHQVEFKRALCVDHEHKTGKVRSLLCGNCNKTLGLIKENKMTLLSLFDYLEEHQ